jgi:malate dehydrogenase (oxaloacetate-decarboxylating)
MAKDAILFAMANPIPEIMPDIAKQANARVIGTGRSDFPNQINNVLAFPGIFRGALDCRARDITEDMKIAATLAIAEMIPKDRLHEENLLPDAFDRNIARVVADAVIKCARETGVARI